MKKLTVLIIVLIVLCSCVRKVCPAYSQVGNMKPTISYRK
jgi:hypothetical protein